MQVITNFPFETKEIENEWTLHIAFNSPTFELMELLLKSLAIQGKSINTSIIESVTIADDGHTIDITISPTNGLRRSRLYHGYIPHSTSYALEIIAFAKDESGEIIGGGVGDSWTSTFEDGKLVAVEPYSPKTTSDGHAFFLEQTFLQLLFGHRTLKELNHIYPDCYTRREETAILLRILFPKKPSEYLPNKSVDTSPEFRR